MTSEQIHDKWCRDMPNCSGSQRDNCSLMADLRQFYDQMEADCLEVIDERDHWEEVIGQLAADAGCPREWSSLHEHGECIKEKIGTKG